MIDLSLNEVETLCAKAARGAGFSWGLSEDIGRAARRIAGGDQSWGVAMLSLAENARSFAPPGAVRVKRWIDGEADLAGEAPLCPVRTAAVLLDDPPPAQAMPLTIVDVGLPIWLVAMLRGSSMHARTPTAPLTAPRADVVVDRSTSAGQPTGIRRGVIDRQILSALNAFAAKTYVPESDGSRARGAGGGRVDDE